MQKSVDSYQKFKDYIWQDYKPIPMEKMSQGDGFKPNVNWAMRHAPRFHQTLKVLEKHCANVKSILDVGAFPGSFARLCQQYYGDSVTVAACGFANSNEFPDQLSQIGINFKNCNIDPDVVSSGDAPRGLPYENCSFDLVLCLEVVEHLYSARTLFEECQRVLKPGGFLLITTDNIKSRSGMLRLVRDHSTNLDDELACTSIWSSHEDQWRGHVRFYSAKQLVEVAEKVKLEMIDCSFFEHFEDPESLNFESKSVLSKIRKILRGNGSRPPIRLKELLHSIWYLGWRSLRSDYNNRIQVLFQKK